MNPVRRSFIPPSAWEAIKNEVALPDSVTGDFPPQVARSLVPLPRLLALIIDCTGLRASKSHFGLAQAMELACRLGPVRTYLTDLPHKTSYECWLHCCKVIGKGRRARQALPGVSASATPPRAVLPTHVEGDKQPHAAYVYEGFDCKAEDYKLSERALEAVEDWLEGPVRRRWIRPLVDGMSLRWTEGDDIDWEKERIWDDEYEADDD